MGIVAIVPLAALVALLESMSAETIGAMMLGIAPYRATGSALWILFPLVLYALGLLVSIAGLSVLPAFIREPEPPWRPAAAGFVLTAALALAGLLIAAKLMLGGHWYWFFACGLVGLLAAPAFAAIAGYYTQLPWRPVRSIAGATRTGVATNLIIGMSLGLETTAAAAVTISAALAAAYLLGSHASITGVSGVQAGMFGTAVATMGLLMVAAYVLALDASSAIVDNAGGIATMAGASPEESQPIGALIPAGNTAKTFARGYALASAGLAAFLLFSAFLDEVRQLAPHSEPSTVDLAHVWVFVGGLLGTMLVFLFASLTLRAVGGAAELVIEEVRTQLRAGGGTTQRAPLPDCSRVGEIVAGAALRRMLPPGLLAVSLPVLVGLAFRASGLDPGAGWQALAGFVMIGTIGGLLLAMALSNAGGTWANAEKFVEDGSLSDGGGLELKAGTAAYAAMIAGDSVGDPFKDVAASALHVLINLLSIMAIVLAPLFVLR